MYEYDYEICMLQEEIQQLETGVRQSILFDEDRLKQTRFSSIALQFFVEDKMLIIASNNSDIMPINEVKKLISYLEYTVNNFNEKESIQRELQNKRELLEARKIELSKPKKTINKIGEVYLIKGENNRYKIGFSKNSESRTKALKLSSCENHELIHKIKVKNPHKREQELHCMFNKKRTHSEWFELDNSDVEYIKGLCDEL